MEIVPSRRLASLGSYAFAEVDAAVERLRAQGIEPIDFGVGDPSDPTPPLVREACREAVERHATSGYPGYTGSLRFREAAAAWMERRFGVRLDPAREVNSSIGSKEAIFHLAEVLLDPGDVALCPNPGYPPYARGTLFAEGRPYRYALTGEDGFLPDLERVIPEEVAARAKVLWLCYPNAPTGRVAPLAYLERVIAWAHARGIVVCSDEPYSELYYTDAPPPSALQVTKQGVLVFQSLSKRSAMTGYRVGWVCGDARLVALFKKIKTNVDSGTPDFVQDAAIAALADEDHVAAFRAEYRRRRDVLVEALGEAGLERSAPEGAIYLWQRLPEGVGAVEFARRLLAPEIAVVCTPGTWISDGMPDGTNPGEGYVRFALVPPFEAHVEAARRIAAHAGLGR